jgi:hypothetical protein
MHWRHVDDPSVPSHVLHRHAEDGSGGTTSERVTCAERATVGVNPPKRGHLGIDLLSRAPEDDLPTTLGSQDLRQEPLRTRRKVLESLVDGQRLLLAGRRFSGSGVEAWREVEERGYEGLVAKDIGGRTLSWLMVKQPGYRVEGRGFQSH